MAAANVGLQTSSLFYTHPPSGKGQLGGPHWILSAQGSVRHTPQVEEMIGGLTIL